MGATIGLPTGLGGSYTRGRNTEYQRNSTTPKRARAQPPQLILRTYNHGRKSGVDAYASLIVLKGSYTLPLNAQWQPKTIHGAHCAPVHTNHHNSREISDEFAQNFSRLTDYLYRGQTSLLQGNAIWLPPSHPVKA